MEKELFNDNFWLSTSEPEETIIENEKEVTHKKKHFKIIFGKKKPITVYIKKDHEDKLADKDELVEEAYMHLQYKYKDHFTVEL